MLENCQLTWGSFAQFPPPKKGHVFGSQHKQTRHEESWQIT